MLIDCERKNNKICLSLVGNKINDCEYVEQSEYKIKHDSSVKDIRECYDNMRKSYGDFDNKIQIVDYISMVGNFKSSLSSKDNNNLLSGKMDDIISKFENDELYKMYLNYNKI